MNINNRKLDIFFTKNKVLKLQSDYKLITVNIYPFYSPDRILDIFEDEGELLIQLRKEDILKYQYYNNEDAFIFSLNDNNDYVGIPSKEIEMLLKHCKVED